MDSWKLQKNLEKTYKNGLLKLVTLDIINPFISGKEFFREIDFHVKKNDAIDLVFLNIYFLFFLQCVLPYQLIS